MATSFGLLLLRVVVGLVIAGHGSQKLLGWFGGQGFDNTVGWLKSQGFKPAWLWTLFATIGEFGGGLLLALGLLTPLAAIVIFAAMFMAVIKVHWANGFWNAKGGYEFPLVLLVAAVAIGLVGPGSYAIDTLIGFVLPVPLFALGLLVALIVVFVGLITSRQTIAEHATI
ncbi:MAG: DoxX family protein [Ktedonobacteraceae bacterium]|nr:DoxX family protein [Ktedonobacteraceae bacterium]